MDTQVIAPALSTFANFLYASLDQKLKSCWESQNYREVGIDQYFLSKETKTVYTKVSTGKN